MKKMDILGDPGKVTVFANSAGSFCAFCLYVSPQCEVSHILSLTFLAFNFKSLCVASVRGNQHFVFNFNPIWLSVMGFQLLRAIFPTPVKK